jgi:proline iminopeptidase
MTVTTRVGDFPVTVGGVGPDTVFVHGGPGVSDYLAPVSDLLANIVRSHRYTMRGIAPSPLAGPFTVGQHVADAVCILDGLGLDRAVLLGHSWGGLVAAAITVAHPGRVRAMVLIDSTGLTRNGGIDEFFAHFDNAYSPEDAERVAELERTDDERGLTADEQDEWRRIDWRYCHADPAHPPPFLEREVNPVAGAEGMTDTRKLLAEDFFRPLRSHSIPTLVLSGAKGPFPPWVFEDMTVLIPGAVAQVIPDAGHYPWYEQPTAMKTSIAAFLATLAV